jgi:hypothetical protein
MTTQVVRNIDRLNELLDHSSISVPDFRRHVGQNLCNLSWLNKALNKSKTELKHPNKDELFKLLGLNPKDMFQPYSPELKQPD